MPGWLIFIIVVAIVVGLVSWLLFEDSVVPIEPGHLGLLLFRGKATDKVLLPGPHFVPTFWRRMVQAYPSLEMSYRAGDDGAASESEFERSGPPLTAVLGDRTTVSLSYTLRFRLDPGRLRSVHERFGADGIWPAVRDLSGVAVRNALSDEAVGVDDMFGLPRVALQTRLATQLGETLGADGFTMVLFAIGDVALGRTGEVIQATARARHELEREDAEAATRTARARHDADLEVLVAGSSMDAALRYREVDAWREVAQTLVERSAVLPAAPRTSSTPPSRDQPTPATPPIEPEEVAGP